MKISVSNTLGDLASDTKKVAVGTRRRLVGVVREGAITGNTVARDNARRSSGSHGKLYPRAFSWEMGSSLFGAAGAITAEYGPDAGKPQGGMKFETGSRNQKPHHDLAKSQDLVGPAMAGGVRDVLDDMFWPA